MLHIVTHRLNTALFISQSLVTTTKIFFTITCSNTKGRERRGDRENIGEGRGSWEIKREWAEERETRVGERDIAGRGRSQREGE